MSFIIFSKGTTDFPKVRKISWIVLKTRLSTRQATEKISARIQARSPDNELLDRTGNDELMPGEETKVKKGAAEMWGRHMDASGQTGL